MFMNAKGFMLQDTLFAFSLFILLATIITPTIIQIRTETVNISKREAMLHTLHDEIQRVTWDVYSEPAPSTPIKVNGHEALLTFRRSNNLIEGCIEWENMSSRNESECLYAKQWE